MKKHFALLLTVLLILALGAVSAAAEGSVTMISGSGFGNYLAEKTDYEVSGYSVSVINFHSNYEGDLPEGINLAANEADAGKIVCVVSLESTKSFEEYQFNYYCLDIYCKDTIAFGESCDEMFAYWYCLHSIDLTEVDLSNVTNMKSMFMMSGLESINLTGANTPKLTNTRYMFYDTSCESIDVSDLDTANVTEMDYMFGGCNKLKTLDVSGFDTRNVTNMSGMFCGCSNLKTLDLSNFDTQKVTDMNSMFSSCSFDSLDLSSFDTQNVTSMYAMFYSCAITSLDLSSFHTPKLTSTDSMFCESGINSLDLSGFDTSHLTSSSDMFTDCNLKKLKLGLGWEWGEIEFFNPSVTEGYTGYWYQLENGIRYKGSVSIYDYESHHIPDGAGTYYAEKPMQGFYLTFTAPEKLYDGKPKEATVKSNTEGVGEITVYYSDSLTGEFTTTAPKDVPDNEERLYYVKASVSHGTEYTYLNLYDSPVWSFTVTPRQVTITSDSATKVYDGTKLVANGCTIGGDGFADGEGAEVEAYGSMTDVGVANNLLKYTLKKGTSECNYLIELKCGTLEVTAPPSADARVDADALKEVLDSWEYQGSEKKAYLPISKNVSSADAALVKEAAAGKKTDLYDLQLKVKIDGTEYDIGDSNQQLIPVSYNFDFSTKKDVQVFRVHSGNLEELTAEPNNDGEYVCFNTKANTLTVNAKKYSTYAICYNERPVPATGDSAPVAALALLGAMAAVLVCAMLRRGKKAR